MFVHDTSSGLSAARYTLSGGKRGIMQTVQLMRQLVNEYKQSLPIRGLALNLVEFIGPKDDEAEIEALFYFVQRNIRYVKDIHGIETLTTPDKLLQVGQGDCDDKATLLASLLESIGYETMFVLAGYGLDKQFQHVYVQVIFPGGSIPLDATEPEPAGYEPPNATVKLYVRG